MELCEALVDDCYSTSTLSVKLWGSVCDSNHLKAMHIAFLQLVKTHSTGRDCWLRYLYSVAQLVDVKREKSGSVVLGLKRCYYKLLVINIVCFV